MLNKLASFGKLLLEGLGAQLAGLAVHGHFQQGRAAIQTFQHIAHLGMFEQDAYLVPCYHGFPAHLFMLTDHSIASLIDHTLLKPEATATDIRKVCEEARRYGFASVCVNSYWVPLVAQELAGSLVKVCSVVGFPLGASSTSSKVDETQIAVKEGAQEIDMVLNIGELRAGNHRVVEDDIRAVVSAAHATGAIVKVILETCLLDESQKITACRLAKNAQADFVKTSTGFSTGGATVEDVALMRREVGLQMGVKASGGVRTLEDLQKMLAAGASRIGASASVRIIEAAVGKA